MAQMVIENYSEKTVSIDLGEMEKDGVENINIYMVSNPRKPSAAKRPKLCQDILSCINRHPEIRILISEITEDYIKLEPEDAAEGPAEFIIPFGLGERIECTGSKNQVTDLFLKDLFITIQKSSNNFFYACSLKDNLGYEKNGMYELNESGEDMEDKDKNFVSLEQYQEKVSE